MEKSCRVTRLRLSVLQIRSSHSWSRKDGPPRARARTTEQCSREKQRREGREARTRRNRGRRTEGLGGEGGWRGRRSSTSVVYSCSIMPRPLQASSCARIFSRPPSRPPPRSRDREIFDTSCDAFITHRLPPTDSSWWLRRAPCCPRSPRPGTAFDSRSSARPSARPWRVTDVCTRRPCYSPRTRATACCRTRCARSCQRRRKAGGPDAAPDCCDMPVGIRRSRRVLGAEIVQWTSAHSSRSTSGTFSFLAREFMNETYNG